MTRFLLPDLATAFVLAGTPRLALELGAALGLAVLLFTLLAEPGEPPRKGLLRRLAFTTLGLVVFLVLIQPQPAMSGSPGRAFEAYVRGSLAARQSFARNPMLRGEVFSTGDVSTARLNDAIRQYEAAIRAYPASVTYQRECAALYAAAGRWADARRAGERAAALLAQRGDPSAPEERRVWELAGDIAPPRPGDLPVIAAYARHAGWFGRILRYAVDLRLHRTDAARKDLAVVAREADAQLVWMLLFGVGRVALGVLGGMLLIGLGIAISTRAIRGIPAEIHPVAPILWEAFVLYMFLTVAPALPRLAQHPGSGLAVRRPGAVIGMALLTESLGFAAIAYLWWRLRRRGLTLAEVGLHVRRLPGDAGWGALAYVATQPLILLAALVTSQLTERYFPNAPPPYHPVIGLMLGSAGFWLRAGLFALLAVAAPLFEEIFFRGALHGALRRRFGAGWGALLSATVFGMLHPQLPLGFLPIFLLGFTFSLLYEWRQSLIPGMVMHALNNGLIFLTMQVIFSNGR